jgi:hypothetical protein
LFIPRFSGATYGDTIYIKMRSVHNFMRLWWIRKGILNLLTNIKCFTAEYKNEMLETFYKSKHFYLTGHELNICQI